MHAHIVTAVHRPLPDVVLVSLRPKSPRQRLRFFAGQYATLSYMRNGRRTPVRCFSMISSPHDDQTVQFAARIEGNFTRGLAELRPGDSVWIQGPFGEFVIDPEQDRRIVMLAAGIGITPFVSMLRYMHDTQLKLPITLLYSCRSVSSIPLYNEVREALQRLPRAAMQLFATRQSGPVPSELANVTQGRITDEWLDRITQHEYHGSTYFICGPSAFIASMEGGLRERNVSETQIITESFAQKPTAGMRGAMSPAKLIYGLTAAALVIGVLGITSMDLIRNVPKLMSRITPTGQQTGTSSTTSMGNGASSVSSGSTSSSSGGGTTGTSSRAISNPVYEQPISGVS